MEYLKHAPERAKRRMSKNGDRRRHLLGIDELDDLEISAVDDVNSDGHNDDESD